MPLADVIYRIATDADFAAQFQQEPETTLAAAGLSLGEEDIAAVLAVLCGQVRWEKMCSPDWMALEAAPWSIPSPPLGSVPLDPS